MPLTEMTTPGQGGGGGSISPSLKVNEVALSTGSTYNYTVEQGKHYVFTHARNIASGTTADPNTYSGVQILDQFVSVNQNQWSQNVRTFQTYFLATSTTFTVQASGDRNTCNAMLVQLD